MLDDQYTLEQFGELCKSIAEFEVNFEVEFLPNSIQVLVDESTAPADFIDHMISHKFTPVPTGVWLIFEV